MADRVCIKPDGGCKAPVMFVPSAATGSPMILDAAPDPAGNVLVRDGVAVAISLLVQPRDGEQRWMPHWATCTKWLAKKARDRAAKAGSGP